jgi:DNA-binding protein HU-beta
MTKNDLVQAVIDKVGINKTDATLAVDVVFDEIVNGIMSGEIVKVRGFGNFVAVRRRARKGYNIHSKKVVTLPEKNVPKFSPGKFLTESAAEAAVKFYEDGKPYKVKDGEKKAVAKPAAAPPAAPAAEKKTAPEAKPQAPSKPAAVKAPEPPVTSASGFRIPTSAGQQDYSQDQEHVRAFRMARTFVSDLKMYHKDLVDKAKKSNDFFKSLEKQIRDMEHTFEQRVSERVRNQRNYLKELLDKLASE